MNVIWKKKLELKCGRMIVEYFWSLQIKLNYTTFKFFSHLNYIIEVFHSLIKATQHASFLLNDHKSKFLNLI
jgi:hypothetical protein